MAGKKLYRGAYRAARKVGKYLWVLDSIAAITQTNGNQAFTTLLSTVNEGNLPPLNID